MKTIAIIEGLASGLWHHGGRKAGIPRELLEKLCAIYPEGRIGNQGHSFRSTLTADDPRTLALLDLLDKSKMRPWQGRRKRIKEEEFAFHVQRIYDDTDLSACEYLELAPGGEDMYARGEGRLGSCEIAQMDEPGKAEILTLGLGSYTRIAVQRAKDFLEAANLTGLKFLPVEKSYESIDYDLYDEEDTWWELESDIELPPLSSSVTLETRDGRPFRGDFTEGCIRREGFYTHPELHYRRADLEHFGPFDAARTHEHFHPRGPAPRSRAFVVSKRFYQVCRQHGVRTGWVPVRIDEE